MTVESPTKNRFTATFQDAGLEKAYQLYSREHFTGKDRIMFYVAILVYALYVFLDFFTLQNARFEVMTMRVILSVLALGMIGVTYFEFGKKYIQYVCFGLMITGGVSVSFMIRMEGSLAPPYYIGLIMMAMILNNLVRIPFLLSFSVLFISYGVFFLLMLGVPYGRDVFAAHFFVLNAFLLCTVATYFLEINRRDEYLKWLANQQYAQKLQFMVDEANSSIKRKNAVLNTLTHVFKTPLHQIIGYAQIIEQESLGPHSVPEYKEFSTSVHSAGKNLLRLVQRILTYSRLDGDILKLSRQKTTTTEIIDCALSRLADEVEEKKLVIEKPETQIRLKVDGALLEQAYYELLANAVEAAPAKSTIALTVTEKEDGTIALSIRDHGNGFDLAMIDEMKNTLERTENFLSVSDKFSLGITLANKIVQTHDGEIDFAHAQDGGTIATILLRPAPETETGTPPSREERPSAETLRQAS